MPHARADSFVGIPTLPKPKTRGAPGENHVDAIQPTMRLTRRVTTRELFQGTALPSHTRDKRNKVEGRARPEGPKSNANS